MLCLRSCYVGDERNSGAREDPDGRIVLGYHHRIVITFTPSFYKLDLCLPPNPVDVNVLISHFDDKIARKAHFRVREIIEKHSHESLQMSPFFSSPQPWSLKFNVCWMCVCVLGRETPGVSVHLSSSACQYNVTDTLGPSGL